MFFGRVDGDGSPGRKLLDPENESTSALLFGQVEESPQVHAGTKHIDGAFGSKSVEVLKDLIGDVVGSRCDIDVHGLFLLSLKDG